MERLTFEGNFCDIARCKDVKCPPNTACSQKQVWERLKQYEDTKRTPEQIEALEAAIMGKAVAQITSVRCNVCYARGCTVSGDVVIDTRYGDLVLPGYTTVEKIKEETIEAWNRRVNDV